MTQANFNLLFQHLVDTYGLPTMLFHVSPRTEELKFAESQGFGDSLLRRLESKLGAPRGRTRDMSLRPMHPTILIAEEKTKRGNPTLVHFHGISWVQDVSLFTKELPRQAKSVSCSWGFNRCPDVQCERFAAGMNGADYIAKHISEDKISLSIGPYAKTGRGSASDS